MFRLAVRFLFLAAATACGAMFFEPFFQRLFELGGIDSSTWAAPVLILASGLTGTLWFQLLTAFLVGGSFGVWLDWLMRRFERKPDAKPLGRREAAKSALADLDKYRMQISIMRTFYYTPEQDSAAYSIREAQQHLLQFISMVYDSEQLQNLLRWVRDPEQYVVAIGLATKEKNKYLAYSKICEVALSTMDEMRHRLITTGELQIPLQPLGSAIEKLQ